MQLILDSSSILNKVFWIKFNDFFRKNLGIFNIYVPNYSKNHTSIWRKLLTKLSMNYYWLIGRDFTMVEKLPEKSTIYHKFKP